MIWMVTFITFFVGSGIVLVIWYVSMGETTQELVRGRIEHLRAAQNWTGIAADLKLVRDDMFSSIPVLHRMLSNLPGTSWLQTFLSQAGMKTKPAIIFLWSIVAAFFGYAVAIQFVPIPIAVCVGLVTSLIPLAVVAWKRRQRLNLFEERFPDALDMLGRAVRAGHALTSALQVTVQESPEPISTEFGIAYEEQNYGIPLKDALEHLADRVPLFDVRFLVTALAVQKDAGGNLAEVLDQMSKVIRDRFRIRREIKTKTAMGRLTAGILISLPILMLFMMSMVNASYETILFHDPYGPTILGISALMQLIGAVWLWRIVTIEI